MNAMTGQTLPLRILILALGGEGGGTLMNWIVSAARASGRRVQATSVPGVAQRTGATSYYIEIAPPGGTPILGLMPMPGRVDIVVASELVEAARALETGFVSPALTTLVASTNRVFATAEKIDMGDGRYASDRIIAAAGEMARQAHLHDLDAVARDNRTFISAALFGALAASGALPWDRETSASAIGQGRGAEASLRGFDAAYRTVTGASETAPPAPDPAPPASLQDFAGLPEDLRKVAELGHDRVCDFQDAKYGRLYLDRIRRIVVAADSADHKTASAMTEAARRLALWMAYEDVARVADLKTRPERFARIRRESQMTPDQLLRVTEYMKPRAEELADILPARLGRRIMVRVEKGKSFPGFGRGIHVRSNGVLGFWMLRAVAWLRRIRRRSLRYEREQAAIESWLDALCRSLPDSPDLAEALAALPRLRKGYSDTLERGCRAYARIFETLVVPALSGDPAGTAATDLRRAISAALADDSHARLDQALAGTQETPVPILKAKAAADAD
ncbi:MAG: indolepyruvate oxidoreductase subunit beta family protein [Rhodobacter sp.]|nr:indolepyruvate oxidoreductase subunit beta family protein [Rhodobacter sp.]